jgi:transcriptional regulator of arginine metabolism
MMADLEDTRTRRALIIELVRTRHVATQGDLRDLLRARGHDVTQATLSRDLAKLGARRVSLPSGGTAYEIDNFPARTGEEPSQFVAMAQLVLGIREGATIVVIHTRPGAAPAVAALLDQARLDSIIGSIAGDDTIFVVPERRLTAAALARTLRRLLLPEAQSR